MRSYFQVVGEEGACTAFRFDADGQATSYLLRDAYCEDPLCSGAEVEVTLVAEHDLDRRFCFSLDLFDADIYWDAHHPTEIELALAAEFAGDPSALRLLERHRHLVRAWGLSQWADGPRVPKEDRCYRLAEFDVTRDPFAIPFESGGRTYSAFDQHCVDPRCQCEDVDLSFLDLVEDGREKRVPEELFAAVVDLETGKAREAPRGGRLEPEHLRVLADFQAELGPWQDELRVRRRLVRATAERRLSSEAARVAPRAGRNDPCPCGSGRKYKKCCGAPGGRRAS